MKLEQNDPWKKNRKGAAHNFLEIIYNNVQKNEKWSTDPVRRKVTTDDWLWLSLVWSLTASVWRDGTHTVGSCPEMSSSCTLFHHHGNRTCWPLLSTVCAVKDTARRCPRLKLFCLVWFGFSVPPHPPPHPPSPTWRLSFCSLQTLSGAARCINILFFIADFYFYFLPYFNYSYLCLCPLKNNEETTGTDSLNNHSVHSVSLPCSQQIGPWAMDKTEERGEKGEKGEDPSSVHTAAPKLTLCLISTPRHKSHLCLL